MYKGKINKIVIWGTGKYGNILYESIRKEKCEIICAVDSDMDKNENIWKDDIKIHVPEYLHEIEYDYVIIAMLNDKDVIEMCKEMHIPEKKYFSFWHDSTHGDIINYSGRRVVELQNQIIDLKYLYQARIDNMPYELGIIPAPKMKSAEELLNRIINEGKSLSRFGDGELELMRMRQRPYFQKVDSLLASRLEEVFYSKEKNLLVAVADNFGSLDKYNESGADGIRGYLTKEIRLDLMKLLDNGREYYDAYVSRPYLMYKDKGYAKKIFRLLRKMWDGRNILLVEGEYMRTGVGNDLFSNANSVKRIICPSVNAFDKYQIIFTAVTQMVQKDDLVMICLGPTATVMAYDVCRAGYQAIDMGQIDLEYEWYLRDAAERIAIPGKGVPELSECRTSEACLDEKYLGQIVAELTI